MSLIGRKITLGLTGGIACYKTPYLVRSLVQRGAEVQVVMTQAATRFITPLTMETVSGRPVASEMFPVGEYVATRHIDLAQQCDLLVIAPATANFLGKAANGLADDLLTTVFCARSVPVLIAPAMNSEMWANPAVRSNFERLLDMGCHFVGPAEGAMACDTTGVGRMSEPEEILASIENLLQRRLTNVLDGRRVVVTAGPSREAIDPVRFLSNYSTGKMGYAIAAAAVERGAETVLISGPTCLAPPPGVKLVSFRSTEELHRAVSHEFASADVLIMAAAPADYRTARVRSKKIKKGSDALQVALVPTIDVLKSVTAKKNPAQRVIGFALETENGVVNARRKLKEKNLDLIVLNHVGEDTGFESDTNEVTIIRPRGKPETWSLAGKEQIAARLLDLVSELL